jgi:hypothetical protein
VLLHTPPDATLRPRRSSGAPAPCDDLGTLLLRGQDEDTALVVGDRHVSYGALRDMVAERRRELGGTRRLVLLQASTTLDPVVTHLAALAGGHPVLLVEGGAPGTPAGRHLQGLLERFDPDVVAHGGPDGAGLEVRRRGTRHALHPDLALLLSTSGSTGSPKLVRLSSENVRSNAEAIARYLRLTPADRAATTMPLHYCYGLSVLHSHLVAGASLLLTERSVVEEEFWGEFVRAGATSFAGVPYTFDLLDAAGFPHRTVPGLRCITQAGGRLAPDRVQAYARLGRERGFDLVVMYGQTEATARMAYVPAHLAERAAGAVGVPVPGGRLRVDAEPGETVGELVFSGPGVMLGYAETPADLSAGQDGARAADRRPGPAARGRPVRGRRPRRPRRQGVRPAGRPGPGRDAARLRPGAGARGRPRRPAGALRHRRPSRARCPGAAGELLGLPPHAVQVITVARFPCTSTGKPDHGALARYAAELEEPAGPPGSTGPTRSSGSTASCSGDPTPVPATPSPPWTGTP